MERGIDGVYFVGINTKQKYFFVLGWMQIQGSKLECAWGRTPVRFHHMSSAADAEGAKWRIFLGINTKQKYFFVLGWMQIQGSKLECAWGRTNVRSHHISSAADAVGAPAKHKNKKNAGDDLLSHIASHAVPSTQKSLTSEFGMGSGMASSLLSPARLKKRF